MITVEIFEEYDMVYDQFGTPIAYDFNTFDEALPIIKLSIEQGKTILINTEEE